MKLVFCFLLLCLSSLIAGQTVNLLKSVGISQPTTISGVTTASDDDSYRQSGVSSPAYILDGVQQQLTVSSSDAATILAGIRENEFSVATLIRRTARLPAGKSGSIVLFSIKDGSKTHVEVRIKYEVRLNDRSCPGSCHDIHIEVEWPSGTVTTFNDKELFNSLEDVTVWKYFVVVFRVQEAGADLGQRSAEVVVYLDCTFRRIAVGSFSGSIGSNSVVSICGSGAEKCDNMILQDFLFRDRGYSYSDSKIYCPATTCNTDCVNDRRLIRKEIQREKTKQDEMAVRLVDCEALRVRYPPGYCVTSTGFHVDVGTQYDENSSIRCTCQSHLNLACAVNRICTRNGNTYFPGDQFVDPSDNCNKCTCQSDGQTMCTKANSCPNVDCSRYTNNPKKITPSDSCCPVCEAEYCQRGTIYKEKGLDCTVYPTCENQEGDGCSETQTKAGCVCKKGSVFDHPGDTGVCVRRKWCPCYIRNSQGKITHTLKNGYSARVNGRLCICGESSNVICF